MEVHQLRSFVALAERLHFGETAKALHVSQPALTKRLRQLESGVGAPLLERGRHGARLTGVGRLFLPEAQALVQAWDAAERRIQRAAAGDLGTLQVGFGFHTYELVPRVVARLKKAAPGVHVCLRDMSTGEQVAELQAGTLDVGFVRLPVGPGLETLPVVEDELVVASARTLPASPGQFRLKACAEDPFVLLSRQRSPTFRRHVERLCAKGGFAPRVLQETNDIPTLLALVRAGIGLGFVPLSACRPRPVGIRIHRLRDREACWPVGAAWRAGETSPLRERFLTMLRREAGAGAARIAGRK